MKTWFAASVILAAVLTAGAEDVRLSAGVADVVKLAQAQVNASVIQSFVENSPVAYSPSAEELIYMRQQGVPDSVVAAVIKRGSDLRRQPSVWNSPSPAPAPATQAPIVTQAPPDYTQPAAAVPATAGPAPALLAEDVPPPPGVDYYWAPGYWGWNGGWAWSAGCWLPGVGIGVGWGYPLGWGFYGGRWGYHGRAWGGYRGGYYHGGYAGYRGWGGHGGFVGHPVGAGHFGGGVHVGVGVGGHFGGGVSVGGGAHFGGGGGHGGHR